MRLPFLIVCWVTKTEGSKHKNKSNTCVFLLFPVEKDDLFIFFTLKLIFFFTKCVICYFQLNYLNYNRIVMSRFFSQFKLDFMYYCNSSHVIITKMEYVKNKDNGKLYNTHNIYVCVCMCACSLSSLWWNFHSSKNYHWVHLREGVA